MTVIVAIHTPTGVLIGCDSFMGTVSSHVTTSRPKWFTNGGLLLAYSGGFRAAQLAEHWLRPFRKPRTREDAVGYLVTVVAQAIRAAHDEVGGDAEKIVEKADTTYLLAFRGRAYMLQSDYSITDADSSGGYLACGAGEDFALGALAATEGVAPADRMQRALEATARHCNHVSAPFHVTEQKLPRVRK